MNRIDAIKALLESHLAPTELVIEDESHLHAGHGAVAPGSVYTHLHISMASPAFAGLTRVQQHQCVMHLLREHFAEGLHALRLTLRAATLHKEL